MSVTGEVVAKSSLRITDDPSAPAVREETILAKYPLDYQKLVRLLTKRYTDFKTNKKFYDLKKTLTKNTEYCRTRYLDPEKQNSNRKDIYHPSIIAEFDKHYTRRKKADEQKTIPDIEAAEAPITVAPAKDHSKVA